jgi:hypothetical protein
LATLILTGLASATLLGCGRLPNEVNPAAIGPAASGPAAVQGNATPNGLLGTVVNDVVSLVTQTLNLIGSLGGSLSNGRWQISVPAGAVSGDATITLSLTNLLSDHCQLGITPADKNHFSQPATLTVDCSSVPLSELSSWVIYWYDPATGQWVPVSGSRVDLTKRTVSAPLYHFSQYGAGPATKAGWKPSN